MPPFVEQVIDTLKELAKDPKALFEPDKLKLVVSACKNTMVLMVMTIFGVICYMGIYDTAYRPHTEKLAIVSKSITEMEQKVGEKEHEHNQFKEWVANLKDLHADIPVLNNNQAPQVAAIALSKRIVDIAKGITRTELGSKGLEAPHNIRHVLSFKPLGQKEINIVKDDPNAKNPVLLEQFMYELKLKGTYAGIADVLNQLVLLKDLVEVRSIKVTSAENGSPSNRRSPIVSLTNPDDLDSGEGNKPVELLLTFALYFAKG